VRKLGEGSRLNTDDRTVLEYHAPETLLARNLIEKNQEAIAALRAGALPGSVQAADVPATLLEGARTALDLQDEANARRFVEALQKLPESVGGDIVEGRFDLLNGEAAKAKEKFLAALKLDAGSDEAMSELATAEDRGGEKQEARDVVDRMLQREPGNLEALTQEMEFAVDRGDYRVALLAQLARMKVMPEPGAAEYCRLGAIWMKVKNLTEAEKVLQTGVEKNPYSYACLLAMGEVYRETGRYASARETFGKLVRLYPDLGVDVYKALAEVDVELGKKVEAEEVVRKEERMFPGEK
jgi:tetratricopeptide (TPR) repeat protein